MGNYTLENWFNTDLQRDIWYKKYQHDGESFDEFFERVSGGNKKIKEYMLEKKFLPGGRIIASRGLNKDNRKITYSNCYVITPPEDNIESIFECASKLARTYSYGGGCGIDISKLSPAGAKINNAAKETTGGVSFMNLYSLVTELIGQSGRRGALMISLDCSHPDIESFIDIKNDLEKVTKANISIRITDDFMEAVKTDDFWTLSFRREETGELIEKKVKARDLFNKLVYNNWDMAEPGALFWDRIENWNLLSEDNRFKFAGVNPCAEEPLPAGGSCLLGSINLAAFVENEFEANSEFDFEGFSDAVEEAVIYLNEVLEEGLPLHPLKEQRESVDNWRQIGLGIMGLGDCLIKLGIKYGSESALEICDKIGFVMADRAILTSSKLAKKYGTYPMYDEEAVMSSPYFIANTSKATKKAVKENGLRNSQLLTIAPTGTISTMLGISGGIEPIYNISYVRKTESLHGEDRFYKVYTPIVSSLMEVKELKDEEELPNYVVTAMTLDYKDRINMQSIWQKHIDASISSTVNVPENFTTSDVFDLYIKAWEKGLKGVTIFRDNCRRTGILLNTAPTQSKEENFEFDSVKPISRAALGKTYGTTTKYKTACGNLYVTINRDKSGNIVESFVNTSKNGICKSNIDGLNRMISLCLRSGVLVDEIIDQLKNITCPACVRYKTKGEYLDGISCPDIIAKALKEEYTTELFVGGFKGKEEKEDVDQVAFNLSEDINTMTHCPECGEQLRHEAGCVQCVCGWSKCM
ncbi:MAG: adenosylcobalamin-dependent ribonucleoside-diphosphate reductase [Ruminococcaceae bacterium]|nr:adenosylcobalamin-dependent ribonucleoside-diphosphate reductase [Oscillospiraceae bacterium]